jgi:peroxiredoxin Q/BCP
MAKLKNGEQAPDFTLPWTGEGEFSLSARRGSWVVLAFYPGDFTPTCTKQFCNYRDGREQIDDLDADVVGISPQDIASHEKFIAEHNLTVPLAADVDKDVARRYGVLAGPLVRRAIFILDEAGIIRYRKVSLVGLGYESLEDIEQELAKLG